MAARPVFVHDTGSGQVVHEGPPAEQVPALMDEFVEQLGDEGGPAMVRAAMAHLNVVMVHPHEDGNGRLARVIQSLVLAREGMSSPTARSADATTRPRPTCWSRRAA